MVSSLVVYGIEVNYGRKKVFIIRATEPRATKP